MEVRSKVWVERDGEVVLSEFRAELLTAIAEHGSVRAAAAALGLPLRTAWKKLRLTEDAIGEPLLVSDRGGVDGGHSSLTPRARELVEAFQRVAGPVADEVSTRFVRERKLFGNA